MPKAVLSFPARSVLHHLEPNLRDVIEVFQECLYMPDPGHILVSFGTYAAFLQSPGTPLWLMIVGGPSTGKTEGVNSLVECPQVHQASSLTAPALLSGTSKKDRTANATGGLLRAIGERGFLALKDFTSVLSMPREARQQLLAALREIYDGRWIRLVGSDGGKSIPWEGRIGLLAGVTSDIDNHFEVMSKLGERFVYYRLPELDLPEQEQQAERALNSIDQPHVLAYVVENFFTDLALPPERPKCIDRENDFLKALATLVARCRSSIDRDGQKRTIEFIHAPEAPARLAKQLKLLLTGLAAIGVRAPYRHQLVRKVALDSMPPTRRKVLCALASMKCPATRKDLRQRLRLPDSMIYRALEELQAHRVIFSKPIANDGTVESSDKGPYDNKGNTAFHWDLRSECRDLWERCRVDSELSVDHAVAAGD